MKISSNSKREFRQQNISDNHDKHKTIFDTWTVFVKLWKNGQDAAFNANCKNGRAWLNLSTYLGYHENAMEDSTFTEETPNPKRSKSSPSKQRRNRERAMAFREAVQKKQDIS